MQTENNAALQYIISKGWKYKPSGDDKIELEVCIFCQKSGYGHFYMVTDDTNRNGLWACHRCGKSGNLTTLREEMGDKIKDVESRSDWGKKEIESLPNVEEAHEALLADEDAMDYLVNTRGFSREAIEQFKIGYFPKKYFRECGEVKAIMYPYLVQGNCVFAHWRTLPPAPKAFNSPTGWDAPLFNGEIIKDGLHELTMVEGEANVIAAYDNGIVDLVGVPGANFKKALWIDTLDSLNLEKIYICYDKDKVGQKAAQTLASRIGIEKCYKIVLPDFWIKVDEVEERLGKDLNEWFKYGGGNKEAWDKLKEESVLFDVQGVVSPNNALDELEEFLNGKETLEPTYKTPWEPLNRLLGWEDGDVIDIVAPEKIGKGGRLTTPVLTPLGWKTMGELKIGDELVSIDGKPSFVTGIYPRGIMEFFRVTFSDGRSTETTADHLWKVRCTTEWERQSERIYTTDAIANEYCYPGSRRVSKLYIPLMSGDFGKADLPIDPWLLGVLIGDGCLSDSQKLSFSTEDGEILARVSEIVESYGHEVKLSSKCNYRINNNKSSFLRNKLEELGLWGHLAESKFIPKVYLQSCKEQRLELLRGLMDTDGTASNKHGVISYCTVSKQLADDVVYLVRSLGGIAERRPPQKKHFRYKGELKTGQPAYIIVVRLPEREKAFFLQRKLDRVQIRNNQPRLTFKSIEQTESGEAVCISVSHPSKLYITNDFIVTHNTTLGMNIMEYEVDTYNEDGIIICLEMSTMRMARKWVSHVTQTDDSIPKTKEEAVARLNAMKSAIPLARDKAANRKGDLYFCYPQIKDAEDVYKLIRDCIRRYGVKWVMFDNVQLLADRTLKNNNHRTIHLSQISKTLAGITKDYGIKMIRILQPHRIGKGDMITTDDVDGASQIAKDCDCMMTAWRARIGEMKAADFAGMGYVETEASFDSKMLLGVGLTRYSGGGSVTLEFDGATSTIREYNVARIAAMQAAKPAIGHEAQLAELGIKAAQSAEGIQP
jgi:hypothetical protein